MSIWTSKVGAGLALSILLAGCQPVEGLSGLIPKQDVLTVQGGALRIAGPAHYCPDRGSLRETESSTVVLLGRCSFDSVVPPAVLAVSAGAPGSAAVLEGDGAELAAYLTSQAGRASLSRSGRADDVEIGTALMSGEVFLVRVEDRRQGVYWRGMIGVAGFLVSISALGPDLDPGEGRRLVEAAARALQRANRVGA